MGARQRFEIPQGWVARGFRLEVAATTAEQRELIRQQFGARRFAYNWALAQVKADLDARAVDPSVPALGWSLPALRKAWNQAKQRVAPWWPTCSKEACSSGIADLVAAVHHWSDSKAGRRKGPRVGFPRFKARHRDRGRVRFTTGAMRLEADRRHLTLPVIGRLRSKENTRRLERLVVKGRARVLSMTLSEQGGRLVVSIATIVCHAPAPQPSPTRGAGSTWGSGRNGRSSPTTTTLSSASPIPPRGSRPTASAAGSPGSGPAASSAPEATARRAPSWRPSTSPRWAAGWAGARFGAASPTPGSAWCARPWPTRPPGQAGGCCWPTAGRVVQDPPWLRWLPGRSQAQPARMGVSGVWGDRGPQRQRGP